MLLQEKDDRANRHPVIHRIEYPHGMLQPSRNRVSVVACLQWGSTGKGAVVAKLAEEEDGSRRIFGVRVGGPNAGHTFRWADGTVQAVQSIPIPPFVTPTATGVIGAAGLVHREILEKEWYELCALYRRMQWGRPRLAIDKQATIISDEHMQAEADLKERISSTGEGVGAATAERVMRRAAVVEDDDDLLHWLDEQGIQTEDTVTWLNLLLLDDHRRPTAKRPVHIIVEGTQGALLSLYTSTYYPFCTSRECTPDALLSQVGLTRAHATDTRIYGVLRTYPIRVGGPSGPLPHEVTWDEMFEKTGGHVAVPERTTVTKKIRRIAELDFDIMRRVTAQTRPTHLALTFVDYKYPGVADSAHAGQFLGALDGDLAVEYLQLVEDELGVPVAIAGTGKHQGFYLDTADIWKGMSR